MEGHVLLLLLLVSLGGRTQGATAESHCFNKPSDAEECDNGCIVGYYGDLCNITCPGSCAGKQACSQDEGYCLKGCKAGWHGDRCSQRCPFNCAQNVCDRVTGDCVKGCEDGFFGISCSDRCSVNCEEKRCDSEGVCTCKPGFAGRYCEHECSSFCMDQKCRLNTTAGDILVCTNGCVPGFTGVYCQELCPDNCTQCHENGTCVSDPHDEVVMKKSSRDVRSSSERLSNGCCTSGWTGVNCAVECDNCVEKPHGTGCLIWCSIGFFGDICEKPCRKSCEGYRCNKSTGHCNVCKEGFWGDFCENNCDRRCNTSGCWKKSGECMDCPKTRHGSYCQHKCAEGCEQETCNRNGTCECRYGWTGGRCQVKIGPGCPSSDAITSKTGDHTCVGPCMHGYTGNTCAAHCLKCDNGCGRGNGTCHQPEISVVHQASSPASSATVALLVVIAIELLLTLVLKLMKYRRTGPTGRTGRSGDTEGTEMAHLTQ